MSIHGYEMRNKNSNCHMCCCLSQRAPLGIGFDDDDECVGELQMLMKHISGLFSFFFPFFWGGWGVQREFLHLNYAF